MSKILLIVEGDDEVARELQDQLKQTFKLPEEPVPVAIANNHDDAQDQLPGTFALVITPIHIRKTAASKLSQDEALGLELVKWMNQNHMTANAILIAPTKHLDSSTNLERCVVVESGGGMIEEVVRRAKQLIGEAPQKWLDVEILLRTKQEWAYKIEGKGFGYGLDYKFVKIDQSTLEDAFLYSTILRLEDFTEWQIVWQRIGKLLMDVISKNSEFAEYVNEGMREGGSTTTARVRFVVDPDLYALALEALPHPRSKGRSWMLEAPVYRGLTADTLPPSTGNLFEGGPKISCLIIDASVSGWVPDLGLGLGKLVCPSEECKWLNDMLLDLAKNLNMSGPVVMSPEGEGDLKSTADNAKKMLERQPWSIVHYAGHSYYNPKTNTGYVFFPGEIEGSIKRVELNRFSDWLRKVTLTYFSSCDSGAGPFVFGLATRRVPNIVGFRWSVCDPLAFEFAKEFYGELFAKRSLERAFLKGRQEMYNRHPDDRIWASPVLIKQLGES